MKLLTGNSNKKLSEKIAKYLKERLVNSSIRKFKDGEIYIEINENIRGNNIFIIQSISSPANDNLMEMLLCIDALKRSSAKNITAVIPYFGYARQDRKVAPRTSISAKVIANLITNAGATRVVTVDLHAGQIQGFFDMPVEDLPPIHCVNREVLEEGLNAMLPQMQPKPFKYPISHDLLGIGTTRFRLKYGAQETGKNVYGLSMRTVLKRRTALK